MQNGTRKFSGDKLRQARLRNGWSQAQLARHAGVHERQILRMEKEQHVPRVDMVAAVAFALSAPFDSFFDDEASRERGEAGADDEEDVMAALMTAIRRVVREEIRSAA